MNKKQFNFLFLHSDWWGTDNNIKELRSTSWVSRICQHNSSLFSATFYSACRNKISNWCHLSWFHMRQMKESDWYIPPTSFPFPQNSACLWGNSQLSLQNMKDGRIETPFKVWKLQEPLFNQLLSNFSLPAASAVQFKTHYSNNVYKDQCFNPTGISLA